MPVAPGGTLTVTIVTENTGGIGSILETLPGGFTYVSSDLPADNLLDITGPDLEFSLFLEAIVTYDVTAPMETGDYTFVGSLRTGPGADGLSDVGGATTVTVGTATNGGTDTTDGMDEVNVATAKTTPGSNQSLRVRGMVLYGPTDNITVNLKDFGVPSSIDPAHVLVTQGGSANPTDVEVDGTKVTLIAPFDPAGATPADLSGAVTDVTTIDFRRAAGITLPIRHGDYDIKVSTIPHNRGRW